MLATFSIYRRKFAHRFPDYPDKRRHWAIISGYHAGVSARRFVGRRRRPESRDRQRKTILGESSRNENSHVEDPGRIGADVCSGNAGPQSNAATVSVETAALSFLKPSIKAKNGLTVVWVDSSRNANDRGKIATASGHRTAAPSDQIRCRSSLECSAIPVGVTVLTVDPVSIAEDKALVMVRKFQCSAFGQQGRVRLSTKYQIEPVKSDRTWKVVRAKGIAG